MKKVLFLFLLYFCCLFSGYAQSVALRDTTKIIKLYKKIGQRWDKKEKKIEDTLWIRQRIDTALKMSVQIGYTIGVGQGYRELGNWYNKQKDSVQAENNYLKALEIFNQTGESAPTTHWYLSDFYYEHKNIRLALYHGLMRYEGYLNAKANSKDLAGASQSIIDCYSILNKKDSILFWRKKLIGYLLDSKDSLSAARQMAVSILDYANLTHGEVVCQNPQYAHNLAIEAKILLDIVLQITKKFQKDKDVALTIATAYHNYKCIAAIEVANQQSSYYCNYDTALFYCHLSIEKYSKTEANHYNLNVPSLCCDYATMFLHKALMTEENKKPNGLKFNWLECDNGSSNWNWDYNVYPKLPQSQYFLGDSSIIWAKKGLEILDKHSNTEGGNEMKKNLWDHLALTYYMMDSLDNAIQYWNLVLDTYTKGDVDRTTTWNLKNAYEQKKDYKGIIALGKKIIEKDDMGYSIISLGHWLNDDTEEAIASIKQFIDKSDKGYSREQNLAFGWGLLSYYHHMGLENYFCDSVINQAINTTKTALNYVKEPYNDTLFLRLTNLYVAKNIADSSVHYFKEWTRIRRSQKMKNDSIEHHRLLSLDLYSKFTEFWLSESYDSIIVYGEKILKSEESNVDKSYKEELYSRLYSASFMTKQKDLKIFYSAKMRSLLWENRDIPELTNYVRWAIDSNEMSKGEITHYINNVQKDSSTMLLLAEGFEFLGQYDSAAVYYEKIFQITPTKWLERKEGNRFKAIECYHKSKQYSKVIELSQAVSDTIISTTKAMRYKWKTGELGGLHLLVLNWVKEAICNLAIVGDTIPNNKSPWQPMKDNELNDTNHVLHLKYYENAKYSNTDALIFTANAYFETGQDSLGVLYTENVGDRFIFDNTKEHFLDSLLAINRYKSGLYYLKKGNYDGAVLSLELSESKNIEINGLNKIRLDAEYKRAWSYQTNVSYWRKVNEYLDKVGGEDPENLWKRFEAKYFSSEFENNKADATQLLNKIKNLYNQKGYSTKHPYFFALDISEENLRKLQKSEEEKFKEQGARLEAENQGIKLKYENDLKNSTIAQQNLKNKADSIQNLELKKLSAELEEKNFKTNMLLIISVFASFLALLSLIRVFKQKQNLTEQNHELVKQRDKVNHLKREMTHRVNGNLIHFTNNIKLEILLTKDEAVRKEFEKVGLRLSAMNEVQHIIGELEKAQKPILIDELIKNFTPKVLNQFQQLSVNQEIGHLESFEISYDKALIFAHLLNEILTNACKHAFERVELPIIWIDLLKIGDNQYNLIVKDNGQGFVENYRIREQESLGTKIIKESIRSIDSKAQYTVLNKTDKYGIIHHITFKN